MKHSTLAAALLVLSFNAMGADTNASKPKSTAKADTQAPIAAIENVRDKDGNFIGVKLVNIEGSPDLLKLGLKNGDVVIAADGRRIAAPASFFKALESILKHSNVVDLEVVRGEFRLEFHFDPKEQG